MTLGATRVERMRFGRWVAQVPRDSPRIEPDGLLFVPNTGYYRATGRTRRAAIRRAERFATTSTAGDITLGGRSLQVEVE